MATLYDGVGNQINIASDGSTSIIAPLKDGEYNILGINHRGYNTVAPENTLPAFVLSKTNGFNYVEADVSFTSDGVAVLLHDDTINRTARTADGAELTDSVSIASITYEQALTYDFGIWKGASYAGTPIPTFEDFIVLCKNLGLHPYIEFKTTGAYTEAQIRGVIDTVKACGMKGKVTYISFSSTFLTYVKNYDATARLGYIASSTGAGTMSVIRSLSTGKNDIFIDLSTGVMTDDAVENCISSGVPLEVWTVDRESVILDLHPYISGVTSNTLVAGKVLYDANIT